MRLFYSFQISYKSYYFTKKRGVLKTYLFAAIRNLFANQISDVTQLINEIFTRENRFPLKYLHIKLIDDIFLLQQVIRWE